MERKLFQAFVALTWLTLPLTALKYWSVWDRLPMRIAVHFDANWQPNGWTSREGARLLALGTTAFLLTIFTIASFAAARMSASSLSRWSMLVVFYVVLGLVYYVNIWIVDRSLSAKRTSPAKELIVYRDMKAPARFRG
jgi:Protein of unknown function (DUF1648)